MVFSLAYTIGYLALFIIMAVPRRPLVVKVESTTANRLLPLASGAFLWLTGSARNAVFEAMLFALAGPACMSVMQIAAK